MRSGDKMEWEMKRESRVKCLERKYWSEKVERESMGVRKFRRSGV